MDKEMNEGMVVKIGMWESTQKYSEDKDIKWESSRNLQKINRELTGNQLGNDRESTGS